MVMILFHIKLSIVFLLYLTLIRGEGFNIMVRFMMSSWLMVFGGSRTRKRVCASQKLQSSKTCDFSRYQSGRCV